MLLGKTQDGRAVSALVQSVKSSYVLAMAFIISQAPIANMPKFCLTLTDLVVYKFCGISFGIVGCCCHIQAIRVTRYQANGSVQLSGTADREMIRVYCIPPRVLAVTENHRT